MRFSAFLAGILCFWTFAGVFVANSNSETKSPTELHAAIEVLEVGNEVFSPVVIETPEQTPCVIPADLSELKEHQETFLQTLAELPCDLLLSLTKIQIFTDLNLPRALAGRSLLKLRSDVFSKPEFPSLLIHELAHVLDLGGLRGSAEAGVSTFHDGSLPIFQDDPSIAFYTTSWQDNERKKEEAAPEDFVSGYAMSDPFEDFAESLLLYRRHGRLFRKMARENAMLQQKYTVLKNSVFSGQEFFTGDLNTEVHPRPWDITKL